MRLEPRFSIAKERRFLFKEAPSKYDDKALEHKVDAQLASVSEKLKDPAEALKEVKELSIDLTKHISRDYHKDPTNLLEALVDVETFRKDAKVKELFPGPDESIHGQARRYLGISFSKGFIEKMPKKLAEAVRLRQAMSLKFEIDNGQVTCKAFGIDGTEIPSLSFAFSFESDGLKQFKVQREWIKKDTYTKLNSTQTTKLAEKKEDNSKVYAETAITEYPKAQEKAKKTEGAMTAKAGVSDVGDKFIAPVATFQTAKAPKINPAIQNLGPLTPSGIPTGAVANTIIAQTAPSEPLKTNTLPQAQQMLSARLSNLKSEVSVSDTKISDWVSDNDTWLENWERVNNQAKIRDILTGPPFKVTNSKDAAFHIVRLLEKGSNQNVTAEEIYNHFNLGKEFQDLSYKGFIDTAQKNITNPTVSPQFVLKQAAVIGHINTLMQEIRNMKAIKFEDMPTPNISIDPAVQSKLEEIFGQDEGSKIWYPWTEGLKRWFGGQLNEASAFTMEHAAFGREASTKEEREALRRYMAEQAAGNEMLYKIAEFNKDGSITYNQDRFKANLKTLVDTGVKEIYAGQSIEMKALQYNLNKLGGKDAAISQMQSQLDDLSTPVDELTKKIIRIGYTEQRLADQFSKRTDLKLADSPELADAEKKLIEENPDITQEDLEIVERFLVGGIFVSLHSDMLDPNENGLSLAGVFPQFKLPDGWTVTPTTQGVGLSKSIALKKNSRAVLTLGAQGWYTHGGAHMALKFPAGKNLDFGFGGIVGVTSGLISYGVGGLSFNRELNQVEYTKQQEALQEAGFTEASEALKSGKSYPEISEIILTKTGQYGEYLKGLKDKYKITDEGIVAIFEREQGRIKSDATRGDHEGFHLAPAVTGGGIFGGAIGPIPFVGAYLTLKIGETPITVRRSIAGEHDVADFNQARLEEALKNPELKKTELDPGKIDDLIKSMQEIGRDAKLAYDENGQLAIFRENTSKFNIGQFFNSTESMDEGLRQTIGVNVEKDPDTGAAKLKIKPIGGGSNIRISIDPALKEKLAVRDDSVLLSVFMDSNLVFTREDYFYPFKTAGQYSETFITIKADPKNSRKEIEKQSADQILQLFGKKPVRVPGLNKTGESKVFVISKDIKGGALDEFKKFLDSNKDTLSTSDIQAKYDAWSEIVSKFVNEQPIEKLNAGVQKELVPNTMGEAGYFAEDLYQELQKDNTYKKLSTINTGTTFEQYSANNQKIAELIAQKSAEQGKNLSAADINATMLYLASRSFAEAKDKATVIKRTLEFAKSSVFIPQFKQAISRLNAQGATINTSAETMVGTMIDHLKTTDFNADKYKDFLEGTKFLSAVGTQGEVGLRPVLYYGDKIDLNYGIFNFQEFKLNSPDPQEQDTARVLLELSNPTQELTHKVLSNKEALFLLLGPEEAAKAGEALKSGKVSEKIQNLVNAIRKAELAGAQNLDVSEVSGFEDLKSKGTFIIEFKTKLGAGIYERCTNGTILGYENIKVLYKPVAKGGAKTESYINLNAESALAAYEIILGVKVDFIKEQESKPTEKPPKPPAGKPPKPPTPPTPAGKPNDAPPGTGNTTEP
ncbi:MAG: hypothetical protein WC873_00950 [Candidatus Gracilibacteria bacterium]